MQGLHRQFNMDSGNLDAAGYTHTFVIVLIRQYPIHCRSEVTSDNSTPKRISAGRRNPTGALLLRLVVGAVVSTA